jgi:hypothetical protein
MNANTHQHKESTLDVYGRWCADFGGDPTCRETFTLYLEYLGEEHYTEIAVSGISQELAPIYPEAICEEDVTSAVTRARAHQRKADLQGLEAIVAKMTLGSVEEARDRAIILLGTLGDLTAEEVVSLDVKDIVMDESGVMLQLRYYKRPDRFVTIPNELDLAQAIQEWLDLAEIVTGAIFRSLSADGWPLERRLGQSSACHIRRYRAEAAGQDPSKVRGRPSRKVTGAKARDFESRLAAMSQAETELYEAWAQSEDECKCIRAELAIMTARCAELEAEQTKVRSFG